MVFLAVHAVFMVTYYVAKMVTVCSSMIGQFSDTIIAALRDKLGL